MAAPPLPEHPRAPHRPFDPGRVLWPLAFVAVTVAALARLPASSLGPGSEVVARGGATLVKQIRAVAKLETERLHIEKVIEVADHQARWHGLVAADDKLLFVAVGEVAVGVDLASLSDDDLSFDEASRVARLVLPEPQILAVTMDETRSFVHSRATDWLARRSDTLEGEARRRATQAFSEAARSPEVQAAARAHASEQLTRLARAWGASELVVSFRTGPGV